MVILFQLPMFLNAVINLFKMILPKKLTDRLVMVGSDKTKWVLAQWSNSHGHLPIFRLQEHLPNCCLPQSLGGDVPEQNGDDFYEFCKENASLVEEKYQYLKSWSKKESSLWIFYPILSILPMIIK